LIIIQGEGSASPIFVITKLGELSCDAVPLLPHLPAEPAVPILDICTLKRNSRAY